MMGFLRMDGVYTKSIVQLVMLTFTILLNASSVESRRRSYKQHYNTSPTHSRGSDPLPWWVITLIFVGGVLGIFFCVVALKKVYEKKRKQKMRAMMSRRSINVQRRGSQQRGNTDTTNAHPARGVNAPPSYDQSIADTNDALPPAYSKDVDMTDELSPAGATPTPTDQNRQSISVPMTTNPHVAPPSYAVAQNDGSEVVEVGGAVTMETDQAQGGDSNHETAVMQV